jgi:hypothetical protein
LPGLAFLTAAFGASLIFSLRRSPLATRLTYEVSICQLQNKPKRHPAWEPSVCQ